MKIYDDIDFSTAKPYYSNEEYLTRIGLSETFNLSTYDYFTNQGYSHRFIKEDIDPIISSFWNQNDDTNTYTGFIAAAGFIGTP